MQMLSAAVITLAVSAVGVTQAQMRDTMKPMKPMMKIDQGMVDGILANWKALPKEVAHTTIAKYGMPQEASANRLIWINNGPWKWTELVNEEIEHNFPKPHKDMLYQAIAWKVDGDKFDELAKYDGSVIVERTKGEVGARCDKEEANFLAINLAHDIVMGKRDADDARKMYAEAMMEMKHMEYTKGLRFQPPTGNQGDPDKPATGMKMPR